MSIVTVHGVRIDVAGFSEQGPRPENQDAYAIDRFTDAHLLVLADGMGGEKSGRVAAETAIEALKRVAPIRSVDEARRAVREANALVVRTSQSNPDLYGGMGCAVGLLSFATNGGGPGWIAAHVGDVRIFSRSPDGVLRLETRDHTPAFARWEAGEISLDEIPDSAGANRLQRAIGRGGEPDVAWLPAAPGWTWLIVSDGISKAMRLEELAAALGAPTAEEACEAIRRKVHERGADDNFTAVVARVLGDRPFVAPAGSPPGPTTPTATGTMTSTNRLIGWILLLAALSLAALGISAYNAWLDPTEAERAAEMQRLRQEVDSLRAVVDELRPPVDPFGPSPSGTPPDASGSTGQGR